MTAVVPSKSERIDVRASTPVPEGSDNDMLVTALLGLGLLVTVVYRARAA